MSLANTLYIVVKGICSIYRTTSPLSTDVCIFSESKKAVSDYRNGHQCLSMNTPYAIAKGIRFVTSTVKRTFGLMKHDNL